MKRVLTILVIGLMIASHATAQQYYRPRKRYINLSFSQLEMARTTLPSLKSNYGAAFTVGRTYPVHRVPLAGIVSFGIDATWIDLNYTNYKIKYIYSDEQQIDRDINLDQTSLSYLHQADIGMQVGPSITVNPIADLNIHAYFRYAPTFSLLVGEDAIRSGYASYFVGGGTVSYGVIGLGVEARFGNCNYMTLGNDGGDEQNSGDNKFKSKFSGMRFYVTFRF